jgi:transposase
MIPRGQFAFVALVAAALTLLLAPVPALAQEKKDDVYVRVNGTVDLAAGESVDTLVAVNSESRVAGTVRDTLVIVNQTATVSGDIGRDAIVANGTLRLEPTAHIGGDVVLINGELIRADGAVIAGRVVERRGASVGAEFSRVTAAVSLIAWLGMTLLLERLAEKLVLCEAVAMKQYSADLRERLLGAIDAGLPQAEAARLFGVGLSTITRWRRRRQETGGVVASPRPGRSRRIGREAETALVAQVRAAPDATLVEHCATWAAATGVDVSPATMARALGRVGWPLKKSRSSPPNATRPPGRSGAWKPARSTPPTSSSSTRPAPTPP